MQYLARRPTASKPLCSPDFIPSPADRLRAIAKRVRHLGRGGSRNPIEHFIVERDSTARELEILADRVEAAR